MNAHLKRLAAGLVATLVAAAAPATENSAAAWPAITRTAKPWMRWWWPGSAVQPQQLSAQLRAFAEAGIGGVEITPIYGVRGAEMRDIDYLSPRWVEMLAHTAREAQRLGLGVDMATGTGWPFGGPGVAAADGSQSLLLSGENLGGKATGMKVKRAAPGGEGLVLDPYSPAAMDHYLEPFTKALATLPRGALRSQFHDSFEYFNASWSPALPGEFRALHGYDLQQYAAELAGGKPLDADTLGRIKGDYRRTLAKMHFDYMQRWRDWSHANGFQARNQAHGAPGGLLDLYGAADIPETESFGVTLIPSLRLDAARLSVDPDPALNLIGRFAASAGHVMGRQLVSSETLTWLRENFQESPAAAKPQLDRLFAAGINHIFYHGSTYSPADAAWPGWFFYASTQLNPANPLWRDFAAMHAYVARVQSVLQAGRPDNDILLYWPEADIADDASGLMRQLGMHENGWLVDSAGGRLALALLQAGRSFDFISDAQLARLRVDDGALVAPGGGRYQALVIPHTRRMPMATVNELARLQAAAAPMVFEAMPDDVAGLAQLRERRQQFAKWVTSRATRALVSRGPVLQSAPLARTRREQFPALGLWHTRRARADGFDYFVANYSERAFDGWVALSVPAAQAFLLDPLNGDIGRAALRQNSDGRVSVYLQILPGQSLLLRTASRAPAAGAASNWSYLATDGAGQFQLRMEGVRFLEGGPALPAALPEGQISAWTAAGDPPLLSFSGTARYEIDLFFDRQADEWWLDLGEVRDTARVSFNGKPLGTLWSRPFRVRLVGVQPGFNKLLVDVSNSPANRIRDLDRRKVDWKIMKEINLVDLRYQRFDASGWEVQPAGLTGPISLLPMKRLRPEHVTSPSAP